MIPTTNRPLGAGKISRYAGWTWREYLAESVAHAVFEPASVHPAVREMLKEVMEGARQISNPDADVQNLAYYKWTAYDPDMFPYEFAGGGV